MSGGVGGAQCTLQGVFYPGLSMEAFVAQAEAAGFSTQVTPGTSAVVERRWMAMRAAVIAGRGLMVRRSWSTWQILALIGAVLLVLAACCGPGIYSTVTNSTKS